MFAFLSGISLIVVLVALVVWVYFFFRQRDIPLLTVSALLVLFTWKVVFEIPRMMSSPMFGFGRDPTFDFAFISLVAGLLGIIRGVKGLSGTIFKSVTVLVSWNRIVENGAGKGGSVLGTVERLIIDSHMPGVATKQEPLAIELFGEKRPFLIVQNMKYKEFKMYINARDFGTNLDVSWYFVAEPRFFKTDNVQVRDWRPARHDHEG